MSMLQKFFQRKSTEKKAFGFCRKSRPSTPTTVIELPRKDVKAQDEPSVFVGAMPPPYLRLVLFQEEASERRLLFDSKSFEPQKVQNTRCKASGEATRSSDNGRCANYGRPYQHVYVRGPQDSDILSEMLFGTVGMASRASSLKIHIMKDPPRLMLSRVFCVESSKETGSLERGLDNQRPTSSRRKAQTLPVPTPEPAQPSPMSPYQSLASSLTSKITRSDSSSSLMALLGASIGGTGSLGSRPSSYQFSSNKAHSLPPARQASRDSFTLTHEPHSGIVSRRTKVKIGFALIFQPEPTDSSEFQHFFFEHFPLIESYVTFLKEQVENALNNFKKGGKQEFYENMMEALNNFTSRIQSVYSTPRLSRPVWPTLMSQSSNGLPWKGNDVTVKCFIAELARMVNQHNTKQKNFFMTGLITSTLTHHLGWVNTTELGNDADRESRVIAYNPLWAQLGDLYGAVGTPTKVAKTVVVGEIHEIVSTIISILSYFIRCSAVDEVVQVPTDFSAEAFSNNTSMKMSYVSSDLESSGYILVGDDDEGMNKLLNRDLTSENPPSLNDSTSIPLCNTSKPIDVSKEQKKESHNGSTTSNGSLLCRSRSSPASSTKPHIKFHRQPSTGNFENSSPRIRTNSNDMFAKPRSVQSRRTSRKAAPSTSYSASTRSIPDEVSLDGATASLNSCTISDCHDDGQNQTNESEALFPKPTLPVPRPRTHKRVSSEPFTVCNLKNEPSLVKTKSTHFQPIRKESFVGSLEPKVVNVAHVQRAQPVLAQSPNLLRANQTFGFKTNEKGLNNLRPRSKHVKSMSTPQKLDFTTKFDVSPVHNMPKNPTSPVTNPNSENHRAGVKSSSKATPNTAPAAPSSPQFHFDEGKTKRSTSTGSAVRRNSSGRQKIAARRQNLSHTKKISAERPLPPLKRIPSISLEYDEFSEYFTEDEKEVKFFVGKEFENQSSMSHDQSTATVELSKHQQTVNHDHVATKRKENASKNIRTSIFNDDVTITSEAPSENQSTVAVSIKEKTENLSTVSKKAPPPLPASRPVARKPPARPPVGPNIRSPPPLPAAAPVHKGPIYPSLTNTPTRPTDLALPQSSLYPDLTKTPTTELNGASGVSLYPSLPNCDGTIDDQQSQVVPKEENSSECLSLKTEIPLRDVEIQPCVTRQESVNCDDKRKRRLTYGDLIADYSPEYLWGFALHGTKNQPSLITNVMHELRQSTSIPVLDEQIAEAVTIIADTDRWSVKVLSSHRINSDKLALPALNSKLVNDLLEKIKKLYQMSVPASFCMQQLEQSLGELVMKSKMLADYVSGNTRVKMPQLSAILGIESSDLPLLMAIASCHSPQVGAKFF